MKRIIVTAVLMVVLMTSTVSAATDKDLADAWRDKHCPKAKVVKVVTISQGGYKGKVKARGTTVKYPKKVKKGKKVTVYMVVKNDDVKAMVCLGKVK